MANKQYISIIRLFEHCGIATDDTFNLSRTKKQLQAEFGITQSGFIEVDGHSYSRHDIFEEIDDPAFSKRLIFHKQLWGSPEMLDLLENNKINYDTIGDAFKPFLNNQEFDFFFSPYFVGPFSYLSRTYLAESNMNAMGNLLRFEDFLQPAEREEAFRPVRIFLDENMRTLRNVSRENYEIMRPKIAHWIDTNWHTFFNYLPDEFYEIKQEITVKLINIGVAIQKSRRPDCVSMSEQLILLQDLPEPIRNTINSNHSAYTKSSPGFSWKGGWWVFWIIFMIIKVGASDGCGGKSNNYNFQDFKVIMPDSVLQKFRDTSSLFRKNKDTGNVLQDYIDSARIPGH